MRVAFACLFMFAIVAAIAQKPTALEIARWKNQAAQVTIVRDNYGVPHVYGNSDADAVFGLMFAQCEDDFPRVEANYIEKLGRTAELGGRLVEDLQIRMLIDQDSSKMDFANAPEWLRKLCIAFADGINYYLYTHPKTKPALLTRFEPWWPLLWTDGSIGAISTGGATLQELGQLYQLSATAKSETPSLEDNFTGSNGFAFSPKLTQNQKSILYINPHVTFYFRPEVHMVSNEGLNAYGAVTWGQFFIYQGFNAYCGWMHTSSGADVADLYLLKLDEANENYWFDGKWLPLVKKQIQFPKQQLSYTAQYSHHGPVVARRDGQYLALRHHNRSMNGLIQSWLRTKARGFAEFNRIMDMRENTSNNTVYADKDGNIAYWHGNFMPVRNDSLNWSQPVDGTTSATDWRGLHPLNEMIVVQNPESGWIQNCNSTPYTAAGFSSPDPARYPKYAAPDAENFRGINAVRLWQDAGNLNLDSVIRKSYTTRLPAFELLVPALVGAWQKKPFIPDSLATQVEEAVGRLASWDFHSHDTSATTTLAIEWAEHMARAISRQPLENAQWNAGQVERTRAFAEMSDPEDLIWPLQTAINRLKERFGDWQVPWGYANRYQRLTGNLQETYSDTMPSIAVPFASSAWGALPSYQSRVMPGTNRRYGTGGNSFVAAVEFGDRIRAKSLLAGGNSNNPQSEYFNSEGVAYSRGEFKTVHFYREDVLKHAVKTYRLDKAF